MEDIFTKEVGYTKRHKCVPDGHLNFDFMCPTFGKIGWLPFLLRKMASGICICGTKIQLEEGK